MAQTTEQPTLLVFTRGAERETRRRRLLPARLEPVELAVHHRCLAATLAAGRAAGCAIAVSSPSPLPRAAGAGIRRLPQHGEGFGPRLRAALRRVHGESSGPVLVVGTDTPGLRARHLRAAIGLLDRDPEAVVLGPALDGGIYLLASRRPLDRELAGIAWRRRETVDSLVAALAAAGIRVEMLEPLADLDRPQDLTRWLRLAANDGGEAGDDWGPLLDHLRRLLAALARLAVPPVLGRPRRVAAALPSGRAPPAGR